MSKKSNKVKFGLKNCHYAKATFDEDGSVTYEKPVRIPGAVSLSMDANGEIEPFYADNIAYYVVNNNSGYEGDLEIALIPESFLTDIMHEELDGNGVLAENANVELEHFAFLFEFDGDQRHIRHVLYNCVASRPSIEGETNEDSKEVKTDTLNLQATPLANGYVKAKTGTNTTDEVYRSLGSIDVVAAARSVLQVERDPKDPDIRIVRQIKNSLAPSDGEIRFSITAEEGFHWLECEIAPDPTAEPETPNFESKSEKAAYLIKKLLSEGDMRSREIYMRMSDEGISRRTAENTKKELGIRSYRKMRQWYWSIKPEE